MIVVSFDRINDDKFVESVSFTCQAMFTPKQCSHGRWLAGYESVNLAHPATRSLTPPQTSASYTHPSKIFS